ncbi:MAG TPA: tetratricopeptide repeat protein [Methylomirabilota bacterium]|nr:tetratricopeptide repeat protein [Methylomirabilota bacterium]
MVDLPAGTVTFLFTDVEGSTRLLERHPAGYRVAIARHHAVLRAAIEQHRGVVFETIGDAVYAAFASPRDAVVAALSAQLELLRTSWGETGPLRVRMGLHTGEVERQGGHYFGAALYRCARLAAAGHGGQVLLSSAAAVLVREALPEHAVLHDLGEHRLKDLQRPERIFQLMAAGLPADFPPLRTLEGFRNNLPVPPTPLVGRDREVVAARNLLTHAETRLLTLTGPGGVGKTRLGLQVAADALSQFPDGTFFVDLTPVSADLVIPTVARTLMAPETTGLADYLRERRLLLVLDNFEHVLGAAGGVAQLLAACPGVKVLVTSREPLRLRGERPFPVPPLARDAAIRLFVGRAQTVKPDFAVSDRTAPVVADIVQRLDGLPLAVELAAARVNIFSPEALLARLDHRLSVLTAGPRDLPVRQQTLRQAIAWSHELLTPAEQTLFRRLAVFGGSCTLGAIELVAGVGAIDAMASLVDKSLVRRDETSGEPRFGMLETIREYALDRLQAAGEGERFQRAHADWYLEVAERAESGLLRGARQVEWLESLKDDHDNLRAALAWYVRHGPANHGLRLGGALRRFWRSRGYPAEDREWMSALLALPDAQPRTATRAKALSAAGGFANQRGDYAEARVYFEESLDIYRELGDVDGICWGLVYLGILARYEGNLGAARLLLNEGLALVEQSGDATLRAAALGNLGLVARDMGEVELAERHLTRSLALWREVGDQNGVAWTLSGLAMVARATGRLDVAAARTEESLAAWRQLGDRQNIANVLSTAARLARDQKDFVLARARLTESLAAFKDLGDRRGLAFVLEGFAGLAADEGQPLRAHCLAASAAALRRFIGAEPPPAWRADLERALVMASREVSREALAEAAARGGALTLTDALALALETQARETDRPR